MATAPSRPNVVKTAHSLLYSCCRAYQSPIDKKLTATSATTRSRTRFSTICPVVVGRCQCETAPISVYTQISRFILFSTFAFPLLEIIISPSANSVPTRIESFANSHLLLIDHLQTCISRSMRIENPGVSYQGQCLVQIDGDADADGI